MRRIAFASIYAPHMKNLAHTAKMRNSLLKNLTNNVPDKLKVKRSLTVSAKLISHDSSPARDQRNEINRRR